MLHEILHQIIFYITNKGINLSYPVIAHHGVSRVKHWVFVNYGTICIFEQCQDAEPPISVIVTAYKIWY